MSTIFSLMVMCAAWGSEPEATDLVFRNYNEAWKVAQAERLPLLVIINPGESATDGEALNVVQNRARIDLDGVRRAKHRRKLLQRYIVVEVDATTPHGAQVHKLFNSPTLPRVAIIDRDQRYQLYKSSDALTMEDWNMVLESHRTGDYIPVRSVSRTVVINGQTMDVKTAAALYPNCPSCQQAAMGF